MGASKTKYFKRTILKYELIVRDEAEAEIKEAFHYYESQKTGLGKQFLIHLQTYLERIQAYPKHFPQKRKPYREAFIKRFPFLVIYEILKEKVLVYSIFNTWQNPEKKKK